MHPKLVFRHSKHICVIICNYTRVPYFYGYGYLTLCSRDKGLSLIKLGRLHVLPHTHISLQYYYLDPDDCAFASPSVEFMIGSRRCNEVKAE